MLRWCWGGSKWLQLNRKEKKTVGIECHAGHLEVARKWREGNWHKPTRFPYFGTQAHALAPLGPSASPVHRQQRHPLFPVSCPACPGLACPTPACRERERERERHRETERARLSRHAGHFSIDRSRSTHGRPCFHEPTRLAGCNPPALHLRAHRVNRSRDSKPLQLPASSLLPPANSDIPISQPPISHPAPSWTTALP